MAKRLIDGNELLRYAKKMEQLALNRVRDTPTNSLCYTRYAAQHTERKEFRELIENAPTVDAVEVIRCRNCIHDGLSTCPMCYIEDKTLVFANHDPDFYCGKGERKGGQAPQREAPCADDRG